MTMQTGLFGTLSTTLPLLFVLSQVGCGDRSVTAHHKQPAVTKSADTPPTPTNDDEPTDRDDNGDAERRRRAFQPANYQPAEDNFKKSDPKNLLKNLLDPGSVVGGLQNVLAPFTDLDSVEATGCYVVLYNEQGNEQISCIQGAIDPTKCTYEHSNQRIKGPLQSCQAVIRSQAKALGCQTAKSTQWLYGTVDQDTVQSSCDKVGGTIVQP